MRRIYQLTVLAENERSRDVSMLGANGKKKEGSERTLKNLGS